MLATARTLPMADYCCAARTNGFAVKDLPRFREEANSIGIKFDVETAQDGRELVVMLGTEEYGFPSGEDADGNEIDLFKWLPTHLAPGEVAVVYESGHEKLRYLSGFATAVNAEGAIVQCSITDVLEKAVVVLGARLDRLTNPTYSGSSLVWPSLPPPLPVEASSSRTMFGSSWSKPRAKRQRPWRCCTASCRR